MCKHGSSEKRESQAQEGLRKVLLRELWDDCERTTGQTPFFKAPQQEPDKCPKRKKQWNTFRRFLAELSETINDHYAGHAAPVRITLCARPKQR